MNVSEAARRELLRARGPDLRAWRRVRLRFVRVTSGRRTTGFLVFAHYPWRLGVIAAGSGRSRRMALADMREELRPE